MTSNLPFGLKVKPARHYFNGGSIYFLVREGELFFIASRTTKTEKAKVMMDKVQSKQHLEQLLKVKSIDEIPRLTEVVV